MKGTDLFEQAAALRREGRSFALATVVARRAPVSAHLGDRAIVFADGRMEGFVGGACSREIIRQQAIEALHARCSRLVSIRTDAGEPPAATGEHVVVPMTCVSEGAIDVYVEPFVAARRLIVAGATPVAEWLARLARTLDYDVVRAVEAREMRDVEAQAAALGVTVVAIDAPRRRACGKTPSSGAELAAVVVSQGHYDEEALEAILNCGVPYVGLVASRTRGAAVRATLESRGVPGAATIRNPAGLDLGARTPPEVALSILAEIVQSRPAGVAAVPPPAAALACRGAGVRRDGDRSRLRHERGRGVGASHGGAGRRGLLLLLRELPLEVSRRPPGVPGPPMTDAAALHDRFRARGYFVDEAFATALQIMLALEKPLLIEGPAGVGKTESAKVLAEVLGTDLIRLQCYEGLDAMAALYEWNYPRQMLHARLSEAEGASLQEREADMFSEPFLLKRPLLDAITRERSPVLLIDEVDRADEAFEAFLLEVLAEWQVTHPRARHDPGAAQAARDPHEQPHAGAVGCAAAALSVSLAAVSVAAAGDRDPARARAGSLGSAGAADRAADAGACASCPCRKRPASRRVSTGRWP